jgi:hypothetical protein
MVAELWYCAREKEARKVLTRRPEDKKKRRDFDRIYTMEIGFAGR